MPNSLLPPLKLSMPDGVSDALKNFILQSNITQFEQQIQDDTMRINLQ